MPGFNPVNVRIIGYIIGDWNAKVGKDISNCITGNFGLGRETSEVINLYNLVVEMTFES